MSVGPSMRHTLLDNRARASAGKRVLFDVDDLVFDPRYTHLIMQTLDQVVDEAGLQAGLAGYRGAGDAALCDGAITTNAFLADVFMTSTMFQHMSFQTS